MSVIDNVLVALRRGRLALERAARARARPRAHRALAESLLAFVGYAAPSIAPPARCRTSTSAWSRSPARLPSRPRVLALDEPAAGLDAADTRRLGELLRKVARRRHGAPGRARHEARHERVRPRRRARRRPEDRRRPARRGRPQPDGCSRPIWARHKHAARDRAAPLAPDARPPARRRAPLRRLRRPRRDPRHRPRGRARASSSPCSAPTAPASRR